MKCFETDLYEVDCTKYLSVVQILACTIYGHRGCRDGRIRMTINLGYIRKRPHKLFQDGEWHKPYYDCGGGNIWMMTYTVPFFGYDHQKQEYFFK